MSYAHNYCVVDFALRAASSAPSTVPLLSTCCAKRRVAFMVDRAPQIAELAVDLHEHLIQVPAPLRIGVRFERERVYG